MADIHDLLNEELKRHGVDADDLARALSSDYADEAMAVRFIERHAEDHAYVASWGRWLVWDGVRWRLDETLGVFDRARTLARDTADELKRIGAKDAIRARILNKQSIAALEALARADRRHARTADVWDADPWLLNTPDGALDLEAGELRPNRREDLCTKLANTGLGGETQRWLAFLDRTFAGDAALIGFVQRMIGYALTGVIHEHALFFLLGSGANGKSVFLNAIRHVLGDYAVVAPEHLLIASKYERHSTDLAMLRGARLAVGHETERDQRWALARVKALTAGDPITARFIKRDNFTFEPQFKLVLAGNHLPAVDEVDEAFRRRLHIVPFGVTIPISERDPELPEKLRAEAPGILAWALEGCQQWQEIGLAPPPVVLAATAEALDEQDALGRFLTERCDLSDPTAATDLQDLFSAWTAWCHVESLAEGSQKRFASRLAQRGLAASKHPKTRRSIYRGVRLVEPGEDGAKASKR